MHKGNTPDRGVALLAGGWVEEAVINKLLLPPSTMFMTVVTAMPQLTIDKYPQHQELWEQQTLQWQLLQFQELHNPPEINFL